MHTFAVGTESAARSDFADAWCDDAAFRRVGLRKIIMNTRHGFGLIDFLYGCACIVFLPLSVLFNTVGFLFYAALFALVCWLLTLIIEFPFSLILALALFAVLLGRRSYQRMEMWVIGNNVSRTLLLLAHLGAGILCGRIIGYHLHRLYATTTPLVTFQIIGAVIVAWLNMNHFFRRAHLTLSKCLSPRHVIR